MNKATWKEFLLLFETKIPLSSMNQTSKGNHFKMRKNMLHVKPGKKKLNCVFCEQILSDFQSNINLRSKLIQKLSNENVITFN